MNNTDGNKVNSDAIPDNDWFDKNMLNIFKMSSYSKVFGKVEIVFRRNVTMKYRDKTGSLDYFGEWSMQLDKPYGRGNCFGENCARVGYYKAGVICSGKVFKVTNSKTEI